MALRLRGIGTTTGDEFAGERVIDPGQVLRIGRSHENDWVVADPTCQVSKRHCAISHQAGRFVLNDLSTNGVFVDDETVPVGREALRPLESGQKLQIGVYRFAVDIDVAEAIPVSAPTSVVSVSSILDGTIAHAEAREVPAQSSSEWLASMPAGGFARASAARPLGWDSAPAFRPPAMAVPEIGPSRFADHLEHFPAIQAVVRLPDSKQKLPPDWNDLSATPAPEGDGNVALLRPAAEPADHVGTRRRLVAAFLDGAGLPGDALDGMNQEIALREAGRMLRIAVEEARKLLSVASCFESEFGIAPETARKSALESTADASSAIKAMMAPPRPHSASGGATLSEGFAQIATHEMALVATIGNVLTRISTTLDPALVRTRSDAGGTPLFAGKQKARYWDALEAGFAALRSDSIAGESLAEIANSLFAEAYTRQTRKADR
jgi:type VI secretion system FHA domain protein